MAMWRNTTDSLRHHSYYKDFLTKAFAPTTPSRLAKKKKKNYERARIFLVIPLRLKRCLASVDR